MVKQKASKDTFQATSFKVEENQGLFKEKWNLRTSPKIQGLFKTANPGEVICPQKVEHSFLKAWTPQFKLPGSAPERVGILLL